MQYLFLLLAIGLSTIGRSTTYSDSLKEKASYIALDSNSNGEGFFIFDSAFVGKRVFFTGEDHRFVESNNAYTLAFLKYLNQKHGVRHLLLELGYTWGEVLNQYIQTGDSALLEVMSKASYVSYQKFFKDLYVYNSSLPDSQKITVTAIDITRDYSVSIHYLNHLIPKKIKAPDELLVSLEVIRSLSAYVAKIDKRERDGNVGYSAGTRYSFYNTLDSLLANYNEYTPLYKQYLGSNFVVFDKVMRSLEEHLIWRRFDQKNMIHKYVYREQFMLKRFEELLKMYPDGKFFGQFGRCHVGRNTSDNECDWLEFRPIATRMNEMENEAINGKVMTLAILYTEGLNMQSVEKSGALPPEIIKWVKQAEKDKIMVYPFEQTIGEEDTLLIEPGKYDFVIIDAKSKLPINFNEDGPEYEDDDEDYADFFPFYGVMSGFHLLKATTGLLPAILDPASAPFGTLLQTTSLQIGFDGFFSEAGLKFAVHYGGYQPQTRNLAFDRKVIFGGSNLGMLTGFTYRLGRSKKLWYHANLPISLSTFKVTYVYPNATRQGLNGFENSESSVFRKQVAFASPSTGFSIPLLRILRLEATGGYHFMLSNKDLGDWRENRQTIAGPAQVWNGWFASCQLNMLFK